MDARKVNCGSETGEPVEAPAAGWFELHRALEAGIPHAAQIMTALDVLGFSYPRPPAFCAQEVDVSSYRVIHRAWREGVLVRMLTVMDAWRTAGGRLPDTARRAEPQQALCEFLEANRRVDPQALRFRLTQESFSTIVPTEQAATVEAIRQRIERVWASR